MYVTVPGDLRISALRHRFSFDVAEPSRSKGTPNDESALDGIIVDVYKRQTLNEERKVLGPDDPQTLSTLNELAEILTPQGRYAEADQIYGELIKAQKGTLGPDHPATLLSMLSLIHI